MRQREDYGSWSSSGRGMQSMMGVISSCDCLQRSDSVCIQPDVYYVQNQKDIVNLIQTAMPDELRRFEMHLLHQKGDYQKNLKETVKLRRTSFPHFLAFRKLLQNNSKSFINPKKTNTHGNTLSLSRFLQFWDSSQQGQQSAQIENKQRKISQKALRQQSTIQHQKQQILQDKNQHQPATKLLHSHYRSKEAALEDWLLQQQRQPLFSRPMDSAEQKDIFHSRAKQKTTWIDQKSFSPKLKQS